MFRRRQQKQPFCIKHSSLQHALTLFLLLWHNIYHGPPPPNL
jgi:hypothetical protein